MPKGGWGGGGFNEKVKVTVEKLFGWGWGGDICFDSSDATIVLQRDSECRVSFLPLGLEAFSVAGGKREKREKSQLRVLPVLQFWELQIN